MTYYCKCSICGIDFISYKSQRTICNKCSTKGSETKEAICKNCGNLFLLYRNPNDENKFEKKVICPECRNITKNKQNNIVHSDLYKGIFTRIENNHYYSKCSKCGCEIEVNPQNKNTTPEGKVRKLCDNCYKEFLNETKEIQCKECNKFFTIGRSKTDGGFLFRDYCDTCYKQKYHPDYKINICKCCGKEFKIYPNADGKFTINKLYCSECSFDNPIIKEKHKATCQIKYGVDWSCLTPMCQNSKLNKTSKINEKFAKMLSDNNIKYEIEWFDENYSRHYDFYINNIDTLIEINPSYTHSILPNAYQGSNISPKLLNYKKWQHLNRTKDIDKRVINVWDWDDWNKILNLIKQKQKFYARKLDIRIIDDETTKIFLNKNHLQGNCRNKEINIGLVDTSSNQLIQIMTFGKPRYNKNYQWELLRLCTHSDYIVVGGSQKLFKYFINNYNPESIISYCDYSKFDGNIYYELNFQFVRLTYPSKIWSKGTAKITDNLLRQRGFDQLFNTNYGKGTSNEQLMIEHGWLPVYDCGQKVFEWKANKE